MVSEAELILKIRELRKLKPEKKWVFLAKKEILGEMGEMRESGVEKIFLPVFRQFVEAFLPRRLTFKPILAFSILALMLTTGGFILIKNTLPGDLLYPVKKLTERTRAFFISQNDKPKAGLELVNKRLEELAEISQTNQVKKIAPSFNEIKTTKSAAKKEVVKLIQGKSEQEAIKIAKEIAPRLKEINDKEKQVLSSLNGDLEEENNESTEKIIVEFLILDLKNSTLTDSQAELFVQAESYYQEGNYSQALEKILEVSQTR